MTFERSDKTGSLHPFIVVPTYKERENLPHFTERLWEAVPDAELLLVDDDSGDGTPDWVAAHPFYEKQLFLLSRPGKQGLGSAYRDGFRWALERHQETPLLAIVHLDADLSHDPRAVPALINALKEADVAIGTRYDKGGGTKNWSKDRLLLSRFSGWYIRFFTRIKLSDPTGGFKAFRPEALAQVLTNPIHSEGYAFQIEVNWLAWQEGLILVEVPIIFGGREAGMSKITGKIVREAVWRVPWLALRGLMRPKRKRK
jgi:glycosyltransferase involved in cell wall biosynthesis